MITVSHDFVDVDAALGRGELSCPGCSARLGPWGSARPRSIRSGVDGLEAVVYRPRRARCSGCGVTHVLLDVRLAARRADAAAVIAEAVERKIVAGWGHRKIAEWLGRPATTVRGWLRAFAGSAARIAERFTSLVVSAAPDAARVWATPAKDGPSVALSVLLAYAEALTRRFGPVGTVAWVQAGIAASAGRLFCASFWAGGATRTGSSGGPL